MKVQVTLDFYDGSKSKSKIVQLDSIETTFLKLTLMNKDICGMSITKVESLHKIMDKTNEN
jgi:hypothetical protein